MASPFGSKGKEPSCSCNCAAVRVYLSFLWLARMSKERIVRKIMIISSSDIRSSSLLQYALEGRNHRQHLPAYIHTAYHIKRHPGKRALRLPRVFPLDKPP